MATKLVLMEKQEQWEAWLETFSFVNRINVQGSGLTLLSNIAVSSVSLSKDYIYFSTFYIPKRKDIMVKVFIGNRETQKYFLEIRQVNFKVSIVRTIS